MLGFAIEKICELMNVIVKKHDKAVWCNGPTCLEVMRYIDGLMAENSWKWLGTMQYYALNKPITLLQHCNNIREFKEALKTAIVCGAQIHVEWEPEDRRGNKETSRMLPVKDKEKLEMINGYNKILNLLKRRSWYLKAHCLKISDNKYWGNIYRKHTGGFIVPIVNLGDGEPDKDITVEIIADEGAQIKKVYGICPDIEGVIELVWNKDSSTDNKIIIKAMIMEAMAIIIEQ